MEQNFLEEMDAMLSAIEDSVWEDVEKWNRECRKSQKVGYKRMLYYPDGDFYFLTQKESDKILDSYEEMGIIPIPEIEIYIVFDEAHVIEHQGCRYVVGPVMIRTELDPTEEEYLYKYKVIDALERLESNDFELRFGGVNIPVFALR